MISTRAVLCAVAALALCSCGDSGANAAAKVIYADFEAAVATMETIEKLHLEEVGEGYCHGYLSVKTQHSSYVDEIEALRYNGEWVWRTIKTVKRGD